MKLDRIECQSTGNRRLLQCVGGLATWQACGKIVSVERADYYEFVVCMRAQLVEKLSLSRPAISGV